MSDTAADTPKLGEAWGDGISEARQAQLRALADRQRKWAAQPESTRGQSVFKDVHLTGADVFWLAEQSGRDEYEKVPNLHLEGAVLRNAHLEGANLDQAHLETTQLSYAQLEGAVLRDAHLEGANLGYSHLERANLVHAHLEAATFGFAHLEGATLFGANLEGANLGYSHLEGATLFEAHLERARLSHARLKGAGLRGARMSVETTLTDVALDGQTRLADVVWNMAPLTQVSWPHHLGDETEAWKSKDENGNPKGAVTRTREFAVAVRANRVLAVTLRSQGLNEEADRFGYRAQVLQRQVLWRRRKPVHAAGSWLLDAVAGYGYKPERSFATYGITILLFAVLYWCVTNDVSLTQGLFTHLVTWLGMTPPPATAQHLQGYEALVVSMTSFHGRGFFQPVQSPGDRVAILAAIEAAVGLLIEITFIATFTQRFFAR